MEAQKLKKWFNDYKEHSNNLSERKKEEDKKRFQNILSGFDNIKLNVDIKEKKEASNYNVFYILKYLVDKEEIVHSPFLMDLLNIKGLHRQKRLFFDEFIKQLDLNQISEKFDFNDDIFFSASTEKWTGDGSMDIFIEYNSPKKRFAIAIENKIFAKDQPKQLERYAAYLEREFGVNFLLLYLTPQQRRPEMSYSIEEKRFNELESNGLIKLITYQKHISSLLENTIPKIESEKVLSIVKQYFQIIKNQFRND